MLAGSQVETRERGERSLGEVQACPVVVAAQLETAAGRRHRERFGKDAEAANHEPSARIGDRQQPVRVVSELGLAVRNDPKQPGLRVVRRRREPGIFEQLGPRRDPHRRILESMPDALSKLQDNESYKSKPAGACAFGDQERRKVALQQR